MIFDQVRVDIETLLRPLWEAKYPGYEWVTENTKVPDLSDSQDPFLKSEVVYASGSEQVTINGVNPITRYRGTLVLRFLVREFTGAKLPNEVLSFLSNTLAYKQVGVVLFKTPVPIPSEDFRGWYKQTLRIPFQADTVRQPT